MERPLGTTEDLSLVIEKDIENQSVGLISSRPRGTEFSCQTTYFIFVFEDFIYLFLE